jgi:hypothetical protein
MGDAKLGRSLDVFDEIRASCRTVAERARLVHVEHAQISTYKRSLHRSCRRPEFDVRHHFFGEESAVVAYCVTLDAVNFGSGYFPHLRKRRGMSGYYTVASALTDRFRREGPFRADELSRLSPIDCARLFGQEPASGPIAELMRLFSESWNDLGRDLVERFEGRFTTLIERAGRSAARLIELLSTQPLFRDVASYGGMDVPLYKRAQILASDLSLALGGSGLGRFEDLERLTLFADNLVPHVLRMDGVLRYDEGLLDRIDRGVLLPSGSEDEVEIRACAVHAVELLVEGFRASGDDVAARDLDIALWTRGQLPKYKAQRRHRTRTTNY